MTAKCQYCRKVLNEVTGQWEERELEIQEVNNVTHKICKPCFEREWDGVQKMKEARAMAEVYDPRAECLGG